MMKLYILGDSFAENLFKRAYNNDIGGEIGKYVQKLEECGIERALWFTDWLEKWGYEIVNLGEGGCSNEDILYQFNYLENNIKDEDRIMVWWTSISRFIWFNEHGRPSVKGHSTSTEDTDELIFIEQSLNRAKSLDVDYGYGKEKITKFLKLLTNHYSKHKPIITSFCPLLQEHIKTNKYYFAYNNNPLFYSLDINMFEGLKRETNNHISDSHNGRQLNHMWAIAVDEMLKSNNDGGYMTNYTLQKKIYQRILDEKINFELPEEWKTFKK